MNVTLSSATSSQIGVSLCTVAYNDSPIFAFERPEILVPEAIGMYSVVVIRVGGSTGSAAVFVQSTLSPALVQGQVNGTVTFGPDDTRATLSLMIQDSDEYEMRSFVLTLVNATAGAVLSSTNSTVTVMDKGDASLPGYPHLEVNTVTGGMFLIFVDSRWFLGGPTAQFYRYELLVRTADGSIVQTAYLNDSSASFSMGGLRNDTVYDITAATVNQLGRGETSPTLQVTTSGATPPSAVQDFNVDAVTAGFARLRWKAPFDQGGQPLSTYVLTINAPQTGATRTIRMDSDVVQANISDLTEMTWYLFSISAVNQAGLESSAAMLNTMTGIRTPPFTPPPPTLVNSTGGMLFFSINAPTDCGGVPLVSFTIFVARLTGGDILYRNYTMPIDQPNASDGPVGSAAIYGLLSNSIYVVRVSILNTEVRNVTFWTCTLGIFCRPISHFLFMIEGIKSFERSSTLFHIRPDSAFSYGHTKACRRGSRRDNARLGGSRGHWRAEAGGICGTDEEFSRERNLVHSDSRL